VVLDIGGQHSDGIDHGGEEVPLLASERLAVLGLGRLDQRVGRVGRDHLATEHERNHSSCYADGVVPDPIPQSRAAISGSSVIERSADEPGGKELHPYTFAKNHAMNSWVSSSSHPR